MLLGSSVGRRRRVALVVLGGASLCRAFQQEVPRGGEPGGLRRKEARGGGVGVEPRRRVGPRRRMGLVRRGARQLASDEFLRLPQFDALSLRSWRRETIVRYSNANQSEPLRILLFAILALALAGCGPIAESIGAAKPEGLALAESYGGAALAAGLFARERGRRTRQLTRLEREHEVADLSVSQTVNAAVRGAQRERTVRSLRGDHRLIVALTSGDRRRFVDERVLPLLRRFDAARVVVVLVSSDDTNDDGQEALGRGALLDALEPRKWRKTFDALAGPGATDAWFALSFKGRSVGSGVGAPDFNQLLGNLMAPIDILEADPPLRNGAAAQAGDVGAVLERQAEFYGALTAGDVGAMGALFGGDDAREESDVVSAALAAGARLDPWASQLKEGARPADLAVGDADCHLLAGGAAAVTTAIESTGKGQTLLATQRWKKIDATWSLVAHETIPFSSGISAMALLRCDARGCVALVK